MLGNPFSYSVQDPCAFVLRISSLHHSRAAVLIVDSVATRACAVQQVSLLFGPHSTLVAALNLFNFGLPVLFRVLDCAP
jgi:hypothetical protein